MSSYVGSVPLTVAVAVILYTASRGVSSHVSCYDLLSPLIAFLSINPKLVICPTTSSSDVLCKDPITAITEESLTTHQHDLHEIITSTDLTRLSTHRAYLPAQYGIGPSRHSSPGVQSSGVTLHTWPGGQVSDYTRRCIHSQLSSMTESKIIIIR